MRVIVTGAAGFIGGRLASELQAREQLDGKAITDLVLVDRMFSKPTPGARQITGDMRDASLRDSLFEKPVQAFFHLAATLTAEAEKDFEKGVEMNTVGLLALLDACRRAGKVRFVFSSSMAAFGGALPDVVTDDLPQRPRTSYGVQKVIAELLLDDYTRRGFLDGRALRLPVVLLRPQGSAPALSEHISAFVREPLFGRPVVCPFAPTTPMPVASVGAVARALLKLYELPSAALGDVRTINLPALGTTVEEMVAAMARRAKPGAKDLIAWKPDAQLQGLLSAMPKGFASPRAESMGIHPEADFDSVIQDLLDHAGG